MLEPDSQSGSLSKPLEEQLIRQAQRGCAKSAHQIISTFQERLHSFVWRMVRNQHDAEEICQDAFMRAFQNLESFDFRFRFSTWLYTIAYRLCLNTLRKQKDVTCDMDFDAPSAPLNRSERQEADVGEQVANSDEAYRLKKIIWENVDHLSPPQRATVLLFYRESLSCQEIGDVLNMPAATVKSHLHRARARLRELLDDKLSENWAGMEIRESAGGG